jgi:para-nitrobenzyl esterase
MFYIYGGGFNIGSSGWPQTDGTNFAKRGVVLVSVGYRLGKFGFFADPALVAEAKGGPAGNYGVMDMIAGLEWVKANIAAFGGDPGNVTVFGESAGGAAVHMLMASPLARGLFHKAIVESGGPFPLKDLTAAEADATAAVAGWGVKEGDLAALRALPADKVLGNATMMQGGSMPMIDGKVVPQDLLAAYKAGAIAHVPIMIGTNSYEAGLFPGWTKGVKERYAAQWPQIAAVFDGFGSGKDEIVAGQLVTDQRFTLPAREAAKDAAASGNPTYVYSFNYLRPSQQGKAPGALHFDEVYAVFGTEPTAPFGGDPNDPAIVDAMEGSWVAFARTGVPRADWPRIGAGSDTVMVFDNKGVRAEKDYLKARLGVAAELPPGPL